jgi:CHAT domain-containing protein
LAFPAVHIATHGKFSSEPEDTYLLAWQERILVKELDSILQISRPQFGQTGAIDLLVLSACETAQGNRRAALGLAGISAQAQVRSTIATLWQVDDRATALLMNKFYEELNEDKTIATALRNAQLYLIEDLGETRPFLWSPFILVGNWL